MLPHSAPSVAMRTGGHAESGHAELPEVAGHVAAPAKVRAGRAAKRAITGPPTARRRMEQRRVPLHPVPAISRNAKLILRIVGPE